MKLIDKFIPFDCVENIYKIDYNKLYSQGFKIILFDLDNTIQRNIDNLPSDLALKQINIIKEVGFKVFILSNNSVERISDTLKYLNIEGYGKSKKPLKKGFNKVLKDLICKGLITKPEEVLMIGDQVLTDVWGANKVNIKPILVKPIDLTTEKWYTSLNRKTEKKIIHKIRKRNKDLYEKMIKILEI